MSLAAPLVAVLVALTLTVSTASAYPTKDEEAYYYNRLHDLPDYKQDTRNLDAIGAKGGSWPSSLVAKSDHDRVPEKGSGNRYDLGSSTHLDGIGGGHLVRDLELGGGGNLLRDLDMLRNRAAFFSRSSRADTDRRSDLDFTQGTILGGSKRGCCEGLGYGGGIFRGVGSGADKRNMDEIDRSSFNSFVKKNFDEIDRSGFGSFVKKNFDEIDRSGFGSFVKRSAAPAAPVAPASEQPHN